MKRLLCALLACPLLAVACSGDSQEAQSAATLPIQVDGTNAAREVTNLAFFPKKTAARPGDTLLFKVSSIGEPHTVTFGSLVDDAMAVVDKAPPKTLADAFLTEPPELTKLPSVFANTPTYKPENQSAGQPCFLDTSAPPLADPCPKRDQPAFDGTQSFYNSGLMRDQSSFRVQLSQNIEPGTYSFVCLIYRAAMTGEISVVDKDAVRPGPAQVEKAGKAELAKALTAFQPTLGQASEATPDKALAGIGAQEGRTVAMVFAPKEATIPVGGSMTWAVLPCHTITFNRPAGPQGDLIATEDGSIRLNPLAYTPAQAPAPPPIPEFQPDFPKPIHFDAGSWSGKGFFNSGGLCALTPEALTYKVTFADPGTYQVVCQFHPYMVGKVTVVE
jgi:plastocyanin